MFAYIPSRKKGYCATRFPALARLVAGRGGVAHGTVAILTVGSRAAGTGGSGFWKCRTSTTRRIGLCPTR
ncbi:MAG: hypothetical protein Q8O55_00800 [Dehalococcoidales bacterium]|nr:hypothetical protein [Dehalococcoidales bacterium]